MCNVSESVSKNKMPKTKLGIHGKQKNAFSDEIQSFVLSS